MLQNAISVLQMISSPIEVLGYFFCSQSWHAVEQIVKRTVISGAMTLSCVVTVMTMLQNVISQTVDSRIGMTNYKWLRF